MGSVATPSDHYYYSHHQEMIKLQLKKPKNWNWQLSTSKSSPHILLPIIQLYNAKGRLLIEAKDDGKNQRRSWHSSDIRIDETKSRNINRETKEIDGKKKEDETHHTTSDKNKKSKKINRSRSSDAVRKLKGSNDDNRKSRIYNQQQNKEHLQKSRSHILVSNTLKQHSIQSSGIGTGSSNSTKTTTIDRSQQQRHKRSRSDDLFRRKLKYNEESLKRAEIDGYKNFIKTQNNDSLSDNNNSKTYKKDEINKETDLENLCCRQYKTRTSSAGTLIIPEECFNNQHRRRGGRRRRQQLTPDTVAENSEIHRITENTRLRHRKTWSNNKHRFNNDSDDDDDDDDKLKTILNGNYPTGLFYSHSDIFPFSKQQYLNKNNNSGAMWKMLTIDKDEKSLEKKRKKKIQRTVDDSNGSTSMSTTSQLYNDGRKLAEFHYNNKWNGNCVNRIKGPVDTDLLRLVRRLSDNNNNNNNNITTDQDVVKMGANVSRHSSKGLSGRRSQSSGSICNGKGRHENGKMCGSLPSYLDDHNSTTGSSSGGGGGGCCNNNHHHDHEKSTLDDDGDDDGDDEVQRIPPLGDGAPLHWKFSDNQTVLCDQGYGSERSPEEEYPPPLPDHDNNSSQCHHHLEPHACYPFITPESTFIVKLTKSSRGLGLSVTGGIDSGGSWPGLIRIKRLFPHQPASACGLLNVGDLLIEANGITLTGLTNYEALEVLRTASNQVELKVCRPPPDVLSCVSPISEVPPPPPRREPPTSLNLSGTTGIYCTPEDDYYHGEFEIKLTKIQGSLGFTLRKEDDSALGHYVRALVREPALTDGRIRAGDKIIAVNDVEISPMSHEQAVKFLRQCGDIVKLRLYRDSAQTPIAALSPTETTPRTSFSKKAHLRQEAVDMLNDIAVRKLIPNNSDSKLSPPSSTTSSSVTTIASPRKLRRPLSTDTSDNSTKYLITDEQFHEGLLHKCQQYDADIVSGNGDDYNLFSIESNDNDDDDDDDKQLSRPNSLDLYNPNQTPIVTRKPRFNFSLAHNAYELNNLDADVLDAPNLQYILNNNDDIVKSTDAECGGDSFPKEPASMPHIPINSSNDNCNKQGFSYKNPVYQSAHPQFNDNQYNKENKEQRLQQQQEEIKEIEKTQLLPPMHEEEEILAIELNRGWNSRLGFSLQGAAGVTYVSAVHADSVAARDGRLKPGDRIIKVNDESVENMKTNEIIDLLRIVRGPVCIVVSRIKSKEDCLKSNA